MRILYLINHAGKAGTEKYVLNLVKFLQDKNAECYFAYNEGGLLSEQMKELGIKSLRLQMKNPFDLKAARTIAAYCKENKIDIIHTQYPRENYIALLAKKMGSGAKVVYTCHLTLHPPKIWALMNKVMLSGNDKIISVCNNGKEILSANGAPENKIEVIFNGIDTVNEQRYRDAIKELGISDDTFVITTLSRLAPEKGLDFLIRSIKLLKSKTKKPFVCLIGGDGELYSELSNLTEELKVENEVKLLGFRRDGDALLCGSDIFVNSASCNEALSFAILEGMAHTLPIVATAIGGNGDIVNDETKCGILVPFGDEEKMSNAFLKLMEDNEFYQECSEGAIKSVKTTFSLQKVLDDTLNIYKEILK